MDWRRYAACLNVDPELFFPVGKAAVWGGLSEDERRRTRRRYHVPA